MSCCDWDQDIRCLKPFMFRCGFYHLYYFTQQVLTDPLARVLTPPHEAVFNTSSVGIHMLIVAVQHLFSPFLLFRHNTQLPQLCLCRAFHHSAEQIRSFENVAGKILFLFKQPLVINYSFPTNFIIIFLKRANQEWRMGRD